MIDGNVEILDGYVFINGVCVDEPYDKDDEGNIMDESWYRNIQNYGTPRPTREIME